MNNHMLTIDNLAPSFVDFFHTLLPVMGYPLALIAWLARRIYRSHRAVRAETAAARLTQSRIVAKWQSYRDQHNQLLRNILHAETDWDSLFFTPALTDPNVPQTYAMLRAMQTANSLRDTAGETPTDLTDPAELITLPYPRAVEDFSLAWDAAQRNARRLGQKGIPHSERKLIREIRTLLDVAEHSAASQTERDLAYRRAQTLLERIESLHIPAQALAQLEERQRLMLTATAHA